MMIRLMDNIHSEKKAYYMIRDYMNVLGRNKWNMRRHTWQMSQKVSFVTCLISSTAAGTDWHHKPLKLESAKQNIDFSLSVIITKTESDESL